MKRILKPCAMGLAIVSAFCMLTGCRTLNEPAVAYYDKSHPHSDTAVFAVNAVMQSAEGRKNLGGAILKVDGRSMHMPSMTWTDPVWVRVLPGDHEFQVTYSKYPKYVVKTISVTGMKPRHVYVEEIHDYGDTYRMETVDTGENSTYTEHLPWATSTKSGDFQATF
ncbi:MAG TPA: hypothetical protein VL997_15935 [Dyella sp.]|nr:hypothetical protein [Dyella sp.]